MQEGDVDGRNQVNEQARHMGGERVNALFDKLGVGLRSVVFSVIAEVAQVVVSDENGDHLKSANNAS